MQQIAHATSWEHPGGQQKPCEIVLTHFAPQDRLLRVIKTLFIFWGATTVFIFIPALHFILVPAAVFTGLGFAIVNGTRKSTLGRASGNCPACGNAIQTNLQNAKVVYPVWTFCPDCEERIKIQRPE